MRITNSMIMNNTASNMNTNKTKVDELNTQMSTQKKINRPSDDPVIAIRALRLRSSLSEIDQYYEKNIPDAESWLAATETALKNMQEIITDIYRQCVNGATDTLNQKDRDTILVSLQNMRDQIYSEGNADYAGRTVFTGYKTNKTLTFQEDTPNISYNITQKFSYNDITQKNYYTGYSEVPTTDDLTAGTLPSTNMEEHTYHRLRLEYDSLGDITQLQYKDAGGNLQDIDGMQINYIDEATGNAQTANVTFVERHYTDWENAYNFEVGDNEVVYVPESGEILFGKNVAAHMSSEKPEMVVSYNKTGFSKGELRPEHYFDCTDTTDLNPDNHIKYVKENQEINYMVAFNQTLAVNTQASDVFDSGMQRDVDELTDAVQMAIRAHEKVDKIDAMMKEEKYASEESQALLQKWKDTAQKEADYADRNMKNLYSEGISKYQGYLTDVTLARTEVGNKGSSLALTKSRMSNQQMTFEKLKSTNEDKELSDVIIEYTAAYTAYQSSMQAASKAIKQTLLDYI
ncbi:MAG: flagellar hook-associated protein 3 [Lachnospiraceae bacterium]|nr:flagellar hook-associated protein 3 [Lachnospiraceae bacterium]